MDFLRFIQQDGGSLSFRHGQWTYQSNLTEGRGDTVDEALEHYKRRRIEHQERVYAVGYKQDHGYGMVAGPTPVLTEMLDMPGNPGQFIVGFGTERGSVDPVTTPIYEWMVDEWVKMSDPSWSNRLHQEDCPAVQIGGSPEKCTCNRRGRFIKGRRGPRQPGDYDS